MMSKHRIAANHPIPQLIMMFQACLTRKEQQRACWLVAKRRVWRTLLFLGVFTPLLLSSIWFAHSVFESLILDRTIGAVGIIIILIVLNAGLMKQLEAEMTEAQLYMAAGSYTKFRIEARPDKDAPDSGHYVAYYPSLGEKHLSAKGTSWQMAVLNLQIVSAYNVRAGNAPAESQAKGAYQMGYDFTYAHEFWGKYWSTQPCN